MLEFDMDNNANCISLLNTDFMLLVGINQLQKLSSLPDYSVHNQFCNLG